MIGRRGGPACWDHAFASGPTSQEGAVSGGVLDAVFSLAERIYTRMHMRRVWAGFRDRARLGERVRLGGGARLIARCPPENVVIGNDVVCRGVIRVEAKGQLTIEDEVYIGDGVIISVADRVTIGAGTLMAHGAQIFDNTSHALDWAERQRHFRGLIGREKKGPIEFPRAAVTIGRHCWLGMNSLVLKGVTVGDRSIVGAGTVVTRDVPSDTVAVWGGELRFLPLTSAAERV
jgi:acetyltransferase-like isoleucine patch superfamily enzyme